VRAAAVVVEVVTAAAGVVLAFWVKALMELAVQSRAVQTAFRGLVGLVVPLAQQAVVKALTTEKAVLTAAAQDQAAEQLGVLV